MDYEESYKLAEQVAVHVREPIHAPIEEELEPQEDAYSLVLIIRGIDRRYHDGVLDLQLGGAADLGEYLAGILDILLEAKVITFDVEEAKKLANPTGDR